MKTILGSGSRLAVVLIEKLVFNVAYENIGVAESHFGAYGHTTDFYIITVSE